MPAGYGQTAVIDTADWRLIVPLKCPLNLTGSRLTATMTGSFGGPPVAIVDSENGSLSWIADPVTGLSQALILNVPVAARDGWRAYGLTTLFFDVHRTVEGSPADEWLGRSGVLVMPATDSELVAAMRPLGQTPALTPGRPGGSAVLLALQTGPQGPPGGQGPPGTPAGGAGAAQIFTQATPAATWTIPHGFGRRPITAVFDASGTELIADLVADDSLVTITFAQPTAGSAVLA